MVDQNYPHQVMLKNDARFRNRLWDISHQAAELGACPLGHNFYFVEEAAYYSVYCFPNHDAADAFLNAWSGEWLSPNDRKQKHWRPRSILRER
jgi:hypothetical protein